MEPDLVGLTVRPHNANLKFLGLLHFLLFISPPLNGMYSVIPQPGFDTNQAPRKVDKIFQCPCHGAENARYTLLSGHTRIHAHFRPASGAASQRIYTREMSRDSYRACNVRANADAATTVREKSRFASCRSTWRIIYIMWIAAAAPDIIGRFEGEKCSG